MDLSKNDLKVGDEVIIISDDSNGMYIGRIGIINDIRLMPKIYTHNVILHDTNLNKQDAWFYEKDLLPHNNNKQLLEDIIND